jgi:hypothetical protein
MTYVEMLKAKTDYEMIEAINSSSSLEEISRKLGVGKKNQLVKNYIKDFAKLHNLAVTSDGKLEKFKTRYTKEELEIAIKHSLCWSDVVKILNVTRVNGYLILKDMANNYLINYDHFDTNLSLRRTKHIKLKNEHVFFCKDSKVARRDLKNKIVRHNLLEYRCRDCGVTDE